MAGELQTAKASLTAHKGHFTRQRKSLEARQKAFIDQSDNEEAWQLLQKTYKRYDNAWVQLDAAFSAVLLLEDDPVFSRAHADCFDIYEQATTEYTRASNIWNAEKQRTDGVGDSGGGAARRVTARSVDSLKPDTLSKSMKPTEFRHWRLRFEDWHTASSFGATDMKSQIAFLRSVLELEISEKVDFTGAADIKTALDTVEQQFMKLYPLINRRVEFLTMNQKEGQTMSEHIVNLTKAGQEADVDSMTPEDLKATRIISSCTNKEMRTKLLEMKPAVANKPTVAELEKVVADVEARKISEDLLTGDKPRNRRTPGRGGPSGPCFRCNEKGHFIKDCKVPKDKLKCTICNTKGLHNTNDRCEGPKDKEKQKKKKKPRSRRSRAATPGPGGEGSATETENETDSSPEEEDRSRRVTTRRVIGKSSIKVLARRKQQQTRRVKAKCSRVTSYPTPPIGIGVKTGRSQKAKMKIYAIPDTGCTASVINSKVAAKCKLSVDKEVDIHLSDAAGKKMRTQGLATMYINAIDGTTQKIEAIVSPDLTDPCLVSWRDLIKLQYLPEGWPNIKPKVRRTSSSSEPTILEEAEGEPVDVWPEDKPWPPEEWGKEITDVIKEFPHLFKNKLEVESRIKAPPMDIDFKEGAKLPQYSHAVEIPAHLRGMADAFIEESLKAGTIEVCNDGDACSPAHFVEKRDAEGNIVGVRLVCDLRKLNEAVKRPTQTFPTGDSIWKQVNTESKRFFKMDMTSGYHQVRLSKEARKYMTFLLPQGKFRYTVAPMGFVASGDWFNTLTDRVLDKIPGVQKEVDDILGQAVDNAGLAEQLREVLQRCHDNNITLSKKKMEVGDDVHFAGFMVGVPGCRPDPHKIVALKNFKTPTNPTEVRSFLGAVNQMSSWWPDLSQHCINLRKLTETRTAWNWLPVHEEDFQRIKDLLTDTANLAPYDLKRETELLTDASRLGLGYVLMQFDEVSKRWRLIRAGSAALKKAQKNYPPIQLELLGLTWALQACNYYLRAHPGFKVKTDHNPLVGLLKKDIRDSSEKLQSMLEVCSRYTFKTEYIPGKKNLVADLLSRNPLWKDVTVTDKCGRVIAFTDTWRTVKDDPRMSEILEAAGSDNTYKEAVQAKMDGLSAEEVKKLPHHHGAREFYKWWNSIEVLEEAILVMDGHRIVVPLAARKDILQLLHVPHMATNRTRKAASKRYFWVGMADEVKKLCEHCQSCRERAPSRPEEPLEMPISKSAIEPMEMLGLDIGQFAGTKYLICIDRYSGYPLVGKLGKSSSTQEVIKLMQGWFRTFGYAKRIRHDDGPEFRDKFVAWLRQIGCKSEVSSAYNPASNGLAEAGVKNVKALLKKCLDSKECFETALAEFRIAPREDGYSPAELFYRRQVRGLLPELPCKVNVTAAEKARDKTQENYTVQRQNRSPSKPLVMGQRVWLQDQQTKKWTMEGVIKSIRNGGRSYVVEMENGAAYLRNRRFIKAATCRTRRVDAGIIKQKLSNKEGTEKIKKRVSFKKMVHFE